MADKYIWGTHKLALDAAEGLKSQIFPSVVKGAITVGIAFLFAPQQVYADVQPFVQLSVASPAVAAAPVPLRPILAAPEIVDLSIGGWALSLSQAPQGPVPPTIFAQQHNPSQIQPQIWKSVDAVVIIPGPIATFFSIPPQTEDRPTSLVWQSLLTGQTPPTIQQLW